MPGRFRLLLCLFLLGCSLGAFAQRDGGGGGTSPFPGQETVQFPRDTSKNREPLPPLEIAVYHSHDPERFYEYPDSTLDHFFQQYHPAFETDVDFQQLGSLGTPAQAAYFGVEERYVPRIGFKQFDLYNRPVDSIRYFRINRTFSDLAYEQGPSKDDFIFKALFTRNLSKEFTLNIDYQRIAHQGMYSRQKSKHTSLALNGSYYRKDGRLRGFYAYLFNNNRQEDNGGITTDTLFSNEFYDDRIDMPIFTEAAFTWRQEHTGSARHYYDLVPIKKDSTGTVIRERRFTAGHEVRFTAGKYKFFDDNLAEDSLYYGVLQTDSRGLRNYVEWQRFENIVELSTFKTKEGEDEPRDKFAVGLHQVYQRSDFEFRDTTLNAIYVFGKWDMKPAKFLDIGAYARIGVGNTGSDYMVKGHLRLNMGKAGIVEGSVVNQRYTPDLNHANMYITQREIYNNDFQKPITTTINARYHLPSTRTTAELGYHLLSNYIYHDTLSYARQASQALSVLQIKGKQELRLGILGFDNMVALQLANDDFIRLPVLSVKSSLFLEGRLFKKVMLIRGGVDFKWNTAYFADDYQAATGQFHLQDQVEIGAYPNLDVFTSFKVQTFRFYLKLENMTDLFTDQINYATPRRPMPDFHIRFGVTWRFLD